MIIVKTSEKVMPVMDCVPKPEGKKGFVPTMGALHEGHLSLINKSKERNALTVCSIFVNPTQFNDKVDFDNYPVTVEKDIYLLEKSGCDVLFLPPINEIYPHGLQQTKFYPLGFIETILEGKFRPGHFQGVCQVVERLLHIVQPDELILGQKDLQQVMVLKKMIALANLHVEVVLGETLREQSGLAKSSRNTRLTNEEHERAAIVNKVMLQCREKIDKVPLRDLVESSKATIMSAGFETIDYFSFHHAGDLSPLQQWMPGDKVVALFAGTIGGVRLIDNLFMN